MSCLVVHFAEVNTWSLFSLNGHLPMSFKSFRSRKRKHEGGELPHLVICFLYRLLQSPKDFISHTLLSVTEP